MQNGTSCIACHINPTGGGMRNAYGNDIVSLEELPMEKWINKGSTNWDGTIGEHLEIGGDFRIQGIQYDSVTTRKTAIFPMQADIYTSLIINRNATIFNKIGVRGRNNFATEYWLLINNLPQNVWFRIGKALPNFGLRVDDHTSFIRGGNYKRTTLGLEEEGLLFDPFLDPPTIIELGLPILGGLYWTSSLSTSINNIIDEQLNNLTTQINYTTSFNNQLKYMIAFSYMEEGPLELLGLSGGLSFSNLTYTFEIDQAKNLILGSTSIANYNQIAWEVIQGIQIIGKHDFFDPQYELLSGSISRYSFGVELYPLNILEIKLQARMNKSDKFGVENPNPEYLIQTHFWF